ncbi:hypothetical protein NDU88_005367 [Pleurodeles waltl]|uniref:Uncharacterized protein n=1 Tax=Pleurodeles waltl TaxID=8319 RepID=A0AAV7M946_PLEWA|nr:hypothetical protein NDU88_005367 [Pleurodeles waltl]
MRTHEGQPLPLDNKDIMAAIQGVRGSLETKIDLLSMESTLVREDLCNMSEKMRPVEDLIAALKAETTTLRKQADELRTSVEAMGTRLEDSGLLKEE